MTRIFSFAVLLAVILAVGYFFFKVMSIFLISLFLALVLVVLFLPLHRQVLRKLPARPRTAAALTTSAVMFVVLLPLSVILTLAAVEGSNLLGQWGEGGIRQRVEEARRSLGLSMPRVDELRFIESSLNSLVEEAAGGATAEGNPQALAHVQEAVEHLERDLEGEVWSDRAPKLDEVLEAIGNARATTPGTLAYQQAVRNAKRQFGDYKRQMLGGPYRTWLVELANPSEEELHLATTRAVSIVPRWISSVGGATTSLAVAVVIGLFVMVISIYFFLVDGPHMLNYVMELSPIDDKYEREIWEEFDRLSRAVVAATLVSAAAQGLLAGIGYWLVGLNSVFLLTVLTGVMAMIPFVGTFIIWLPASLWLAFYEHRPVAGTFLAIYGATIVSMADNFIKPYILHGQSNLHPLIALLSVLGGVQALGPLGVIVGPMLAAFLQVLLDVLHRELRSMEVERVQRAASSPPAGPAG